LNESIIVQKDSLTNLETKIQTEASFLSACVQKLSKNEKIPNVSNQMEIFKELYEQIQNLEIKKSENVDEKKIENLENEKVSIEEVSLDGPPPPMEGIYLINERK
jgi:hypothetical protein